MPKNSCDCSTPPGGRVECEAHQLAICRVKDGLIQSECIDPPAALSGRRLENWALGQITGIPRTLSAVVPGRDQAILGRGVYRDSLTGAVVTFRLPRPKHKSRIRSP